jgi:hypothetical protein
MNPFHESQPSASMLPLPSQVTLSTDNVNKLGDVRVYKRTLTHLHMAFSNPPGSPHPGTIIDHQQSNRSDVYRHTSVISDTVLLAKQN